MENASRFHLLARWFVMITLTSLASPLLWAKTEDRATEKPAAKVTGKSAKKSVKKSKVVGKTAGKGAVKGAATASAKAASVEPVATKEAKGATREVSTVLGNYRTAKSIQAKVKKTITQDALGTEMKSEGVFYFSKGKLRMDIREPERSTLVYDGKNVWFEVPMDDDRVHVTRMRINELKKSDSLLTALFESKDLLNTFKFLKSKSDNGAKTYSFAPKDKKKSEVQKLDITIKKREIERIAYKDQVDNRVLLEFSDVDKAGTVPSDKFAYKLPPKAELTEL